MEHSGKKDIFSLISMAAGCLLFIFILFNIFSGIRAMKPEYTALTEADLNAEFSGQIFYDDHIYTSLGYGISIDPLEPGNPERMSSFIDSSLHDIDLRILGSGLLYVMMVTVIISYFLYVLNRKNRINHILSAVITPFLLWLLFTLCVILMHAVTGIPFRFPGVHELLIIFTSLSCIAGGISLLGLLLRKFRYRKIAAVLAVPLTAALFIAGLLCESGLYAEPYVESFDYIADIDPRVKDPEFRDVYYDETKNVVVLEGREYEPEQIENEAYFRGLKRAGAVVFEVIDPVSGNSLSFLEQILQKPLHILNMVPYLLRSLLLILFSLKFPAGKISSRTK